MIRFFAENRGITLFLLPVLIIIYPVLNHYFINFPPTNELDLNLFGTYTISDSLILSIIAPILALFNSIIINLIFNRMNYHEKTIHLPGFIYIVWLSFFSSLYQLDSILLAHTFLILMIAQILKLNQNEDGRKLIFNAALFAGIATCLHPSIIILFPFLFILLWSMRPFIFRESILLIAGYITPFLYALSILYLSSNNYTQNIEFKTIQFFEQSISLLYIATLLALFIILSLLGVRIKLQKSSIKFRKSTRLLGITVFALTLVSTTDLFQSQDVQSFSILMIVFCMFNTFSYLKKPISFISNSIFLIVLISSIVNFLLK